MYLYHFICFFPFQAEQSLPKEPNETETNISKIRVRKPTGDFLERRFYTENTLQVVYIHSVQ